MFSDILHRALGSPAISVHLGNYPQGTPLIRDPHGDLNTLAPNIPFGVTFMAKHLSEERLISMAYPYELKYGREVRSATKPVVTPTTELSDVVDQPRIINEL